MRAGRGAAGQASVELLAALPALALAAALALQLLLVGYSLTIADGAAEAGALAGASGHDEQRAAREALPGWARGRSRGDRRGRPGAGSSCARRLRSPPSRTRSPSAPRPGLAPRPGVVGDARDPGQPAPTVGPSLGLAAAVAVEAAALTGAGTLLVEVGEAARRRAPTLLAAPARPRHRGRPAGGRAARIRPRAPLPPRRARAGPSRSRTSSGALAASEAELAVVHVPERLWVPALEAEDLAVSGGCLLVSLPGERSLAALAVDELARRRISVRIATRPPSLLAARRALAGVAAGRPGLGESPAASPGGCSAWARVSRGDGGPGAPGAARRGLDPDPGRPGPGGDRRGRDGQGQGAAGGGPGRPLRGAQHARRRAAAAGAAAAARRRAEPSPPLRRPTTSPARGSPRSTPRGATASTRAACGSSFPDAAADPPLRARVTVTGEIDPERAHRRRARRRPPADPGGRLGRRRGIGPGVLLDRDAGAGGGWRLLRAARLSRRRGDAPGRGGRLRPDGGGGAARRDRPGRRLRLPLGRRAGRALRAPSRPALGGAAGALAAPLRDRARPRALVGVRLARRERRPLRLRPAVLLGGLALRLRAPARRPARRRATRSLAGGAARGGGGPRPQLRAAGLRPGAVPGAAAALGVALERLARTARRAADGGVGLQPAGGLAGRRARHRSVHAGDRRAPTACAIPSTRSPRSTRRPT